jgi:hypothetical protein
VTAGGDRTRSRWTPGGAPRAWWVLLLVAWPAHLPAQNRPARMEEPQRVFVGASQIVDFELPAARKALTNKVRVVPETAAVNADLYCWFVTPSYPYLHRDEGKTPGCVVPWPAPSESPASARHEKDRAWSFHIKNRGKAVHVTIYW